MQNVWHAWQVSHPLLQDKFTGLRDQLNEFGGFVVGLVRNQQQQRGAHSYRNAFDVPRKSLLDQVVRMRANFLQPGLLHTKLLDDDYIHSMPLAQMGNYQEYLKRMTPPLREIESVPVRQHMFGNYLDERNASYCFIVMSRSRITRRNNFTPTL